MAEGQSFQLNVLEQLDIHKQKRNIDLNLTPYTKINSKSIIDLNTKGKAIKLLEENIGENRSDLRLGEEFSDRIPKA